MTTPNHACFRHAYATAEKFIDTYDYLPDGNARYPFAYVGESFNMERPNNDLIGEIQQTIHLYGTREQRTALDETTGKIRNTLLQAKAVSGYWLKLDRYTTQYIHDHTTGTPLIHVVVDVSFIYTKER